jgi:Asp-tRNA(Asn)/Glu-tRNA(Gln) amidotransferase A subunit family amidase
MMESSAAAEFADLPVAEIAAALSDRRVSISDLLHAYQDRIRVFNDRFRAFSHLAPPPPTSIDALQAELSNGRARSPLHGLVVSVKGNIPVAALPWTEGSAVFADRVASTDAAIVARARQAGAIVLGTTTLSELAMYGVRNAFEPMGINPWCPERMAGGSSTGAGVAASLRMTAVNIGTDSGGSIRNPACHTGVVGFMASAGTLPVGGVPEHAPSLPALGLIARSVPDVTVAYETLAARTSSDVQPSGRLLVPRRLVDQMCDEETASLFADTLRLIKNSHIEIVEADVASWQEGEAAAGDISLFESARALSRMDCARASDGIRKRRDTGLQITDQMFADACRSAAKFRNEMTAALDTARADALVSPTWPFAAPFIDAQTVSVRRQETAIDPYRSCFVRAANAAVGAALTLPMGLYPQAQVPAGLHLMTAHGRDRSLLTLAASIEKAMPRLPLPPPLRDFANPVPAHAALNPAPANSPIASI